MNINEIIIRLDGLIKWAEKYHKIDDLSQLEIEALKGALKHLKELE